MMDIVVCTDKWFIMPTGVMMQSVCQNNVDETIVFHVIVGENVSKEDKQDLEDLLKAFQGKSVVFYPSSDIDKEIETFPQDSRHLITKATYYRFYFAEILPDFDRDRVHDSDIRKLLTWYNILVKNGITDFEEEMKPTEGDNIDDRKSE